MHVEDDELVFDFTITKGSWFGLGYSCSMTDSDMMLVESDPDGVITITDLWSTGPVYPSKNEHQDYLPPEYLVTPSDEQVKIRTRRLLDTGDINDFVIPLDEAFVINWAGCPCSPTMNYHG